MKQTIYSGQLIPDDIPFEEYFAYLSHLVPISSQSKRLNQLSEEELRIMKNHEARLTAIFYLECKPRSEWTLRDRKILSAVISGSDMVAIHDGIYELIEF